MESLTRAAARLLLAASACLAVASANADGTVGNTLPADFPAILGDYRNSQEIIVGEQPCHLLAIGQRRNDDRLVWPGCFADDRLRITHHQAPEGDDLHQAFAGRVEPSALGSRAPKSAT